MDQWRMIVLAAGDKLLADRKYQVALEVVREIDEHLERGTRHYRDHEGELLADLGAVVDALLAQDGGMGDG